VLSILGWRWFSGPEPTGGSSDAPPATQAGNAPLQRQVDDLLRVATGQYQRRQFSDAMATLDRAVAIDADVGSAKTLQEDVAMQWIRELTVPDGQTFSTAMAQPLAVLDRATPFATGARQGDLLAHLGWASFLRRRDGDRRIDPEDLYRKAIAADPMNPFGNAMLGHWLLWNDTGSGEIERARPLFRIAADAARATDFVRTLQLAALKNHSTVASRLEAVRVLDEMRRRGEPLPASNANDVWSTYYFAMSDNGDLTSRDLLAVLPPSEHLLTLQWAFSDLTRDNQSRGQQLRYYGARLQAAAGQTAAARAALQALKAEFGPSAAGSLPDAVDRALRELGAATNTRPKL